MYTSSKVSSPLLLEDDSKCYNVRKIYITAKFNGKTGVLAVKLERRGFEVARGINEIAMKKIVDEIRKKPASWTDLKEKTKLPEKSVTRYLKTLEFWELAKKNDAGYWDWYERVRNYETEHDYNIALKHSKKLLDILAGFFGVSMIHPEWFQKREVQSLKTLDDLYFSDRVREHLKTGYLSLYEEVVDFDKLIELRNEIRKELAMHESKIEKEKMLEYVAHFRSLKRYVIPKKHWKEVDRLVCQIGPERQAFVEETQKNYNESLVKISNELRRLIFMVEHGEPLLGSCELCPKLKVGN
jgi:hypothetical protein